MKKFVIALFAVVIMISVLTACNPKPVETDTEAATEAETVLETEEASETVDESESIVETDAGQVPVPSPELATA